MTATLCKTSEQNLSAYVITASGNVSTIPIRPQAVTGMGIPY